VSQPPLVAEETELVDPGWKGLYRIGGLAALIAVLFFRRNTGTELMTFDGFGIWAVPASHPDGAAGWFALFQDCAPLALVLYDAIDLINFALVALMLLALYGALRRDNRGAMLLALTSGLSGTVIYLVTNQAFGMLALSNRYAAAASEAQKATYLAAGEALLALYSPGASVQSSGYNASLFLVLLAGLIVSNVMLRSNAFGKWTAWIGIVANGLGLLTFAGMAIGSDLYYLPTVLSAPVRIVWYVLIAIKLLRLGWRRTERKEASG
jgi:hypothetical protein